MDDLASRSGTTKSFLSPQASRMPDMMNSVSPLRRNNPARKGIRIVESGELRVVNSAARQHWDFMKNNHQQLKQHLHDLRFNSNNDRSKLGAANNDNDNSSAILIKIGLTNLNTPSMENLATSVNVKDMNTSLYGHTIREGAPRNKMGPTTFKATGTIIKQHMTEDGNFGANRAIVSPNPSTVDDFQVSGPFKRL